MSLMRRPSLAVCLCVCLVLPLWLTLHAQAPRPATSLLDDLADRRQWFALRDAIERSSATAPPLYRGLVASAFNRGAETERYLTQAIRDARDPADANAAREALVVAYMRHGRFADASPLIDAILAASPGRDDIVNMRDVFGVRRDRPNQQVQLRAGRFSCRVAADGIRVPVSINDTTVHWLLDTGAGISVVSDAEARRLGLTLSRESGRASDFASGTAQVRTARIPRLTIGDTTIQHVPVMVLPEAQPPFDEWPARQEGILGLPVALALQGMRWTRDGACHTGVVARAEARRSSMLAFDEFHVIARVDAAQQPIELLLDTGNQRETSLWQRFTRDFPSLVKQGRPGTKRMTQFGGTRDWPVTILAKLPLRIGGVDLALESASVFAPPVGNEWYHGNLGMDLLSRAREVTLDFQSMTMVLTP